MLFDYLKKVQALARDQSLISLNPEDLISYINEGRRDIAGRAQCVRLITPISGSVSSVDILSGGSEYTSPTVSISSPDFPGGAGGSPNGSQARASVQVVGTAISNVAIEYGGTGYFQPTISVSDPTGTGFDATVNVAGVNIITQGKEQYPFSEIDTTSSPGVGSVFAVNGISILYNNLRYSLPVYSFSDYQAYIRQFPYQYSYVPTFACIRGRGTQGTIYYYPLPSQTYQVELDCFCLPQELSTNQVTEVIPEMLTDAIAYYALYMAYLSLQNFNAARMYFELYEKKVKDYCRYTNVSRRVNPYGRY